MEAKSIIKTVLGKIEALDQRTVEEKKGQKRDLPEMNGASICGINIAVGYADEGGGRDEHD
ncbi:hypothetical protein AALP_AAs47827U000200 [Arabis alpina]|uniref:Uncharacterized protein n=1 Tax=Arabis alpina TaxID=50452 RepID=A0A087G171_ARAAL|nr:hypothetical protein AALP_AAs47827U000200 [Arabis alpina]